MAVRAQLVEARRRELADLRVEQRRLRSCSATEEQVAKDRAQVLLDGELDGLRPQSGPVALVPQVHQLAERAPAVVVARRQTLALLPSEPLALERLEPCGRLRLGLRGRAAPAPIRALEAQPPSSALLVDARHVSPWCDPSRMPSRAVGRGRTGSARRRECTASRRARHARRSRSGRPSGSSPPHARPRVGSGVVLPCSWCPEQYNSTEKQVNTDMTHLCISMYLSRSRPTRYSRTSFTLRLFRSCSRASIIGAGSRYQERASSMRSFTTSLSDCRPVSFIRWSSHARTSSGTRTLMLDSSIVRGVRAMRGA